jgi:lipid II isoglutaminyl synthase (glutamine-hydrolysing)
VGAPWGQRGRHPMTEVLGLRDRVAVGAMRALNATSRVAGRGDGTVVGGRLALRMAPRLAERLASRCDVALVSGTNGKTTTTACLAAALSTRGDVATNATGANMLPGHVAALGSARGATAAVLECDEVWLPRLLDIERPAAMVLLNLSRDQLDRTAEVRHVADAWRAALLDFTGICVANVDDPLVVHAADDAVKVAWFAGGLAFGGDAVACPRCARRLSFDDLGWRCACGLARPAPHAESTASGARVDGHEVRYAMALPGRFNHANGVGALLAAIRLGVDPDTAATAIAGVAEVAGRFSTLEVEGRRARLMLAKNPSGWSALLDLVAHDDVPVVVAINARVADGRDPSWLYDVGFERLAGRRVIASGERWRDVSTRLFYAGVEHDEVPDVHDAIAAAREDAGDVDVIANYTAFAELHRSR